ncbi:hypothetical protein DSOL_0919 [Desulfosporosinus metallidurans]|uniref:Uncharacterized protein n=1 Tax=Desulfosporosinus metallidurans TaxID=1888891 RepID=A0A1Q8R0P7_9FIRM|nr:hypothetical protein DSOL_0919 [Desulfosporosinus metallidurans]
MKIILKGEFICWVGAITCWADGDTVQNIIDILFIFDPLFNKAL